MRIARRPCCLALLLAMGACGVESAPQIPPGLLGGGEPAPAASQPAQGAPTPPARAEDPSRVSEPVPCDPALEALSLHALAHEDLALALPASVFGVAALVDADGVARGFLVHDPATGVSGFAVARTPASASLPEEVTVVRAALGRIASLSDERARSFSTWDGSLAELLAANAGVGSATGVALAQTIAETVAGRGALSSALASTDRPASAFALRLSTIWRGPERAIVVGALAPRPVAAATEIALLDLANGTQVAHAGDGLGSACDPIQARGTVRLDLLWVVDNSISMAEEQRAVAEASREMRAVLESTELSWRLALTTTDRRDGSIASSGVDGFTPASPESARSLGASAWASAVGALGTSGSNEERGLEAGAAAVRRALPVSEAEDRYRVRRGAHVVVVHVSDEEDFDVKLASGGDDHTCPNNTSKRAAIEGFVDRYRALGGEPGVAGLSTFTIHAIQPGLGAACDYEAGTRDCPVRAQHGESYVELASATGGGAGSLCGDMRRTVEDIARQGAGLASPMELSAPPISRTLRVLVSGADGSFDSSIPVPRSLSDGFDHAFEWDPVAGRTTHKIVFYGSHRPEAGRLVRASYRTFEAGSGASCENACGAGEVCLDGACVPTQPNPCGECADGEICDTSTDPPVCREIF